MDAATTLFRRGQIVLNVLLALGLALLVFLSVANQAALVFLPIAVSAAAVAVFVVRRPLVNLFILISGLIVTSGYSVGITAPELIHGSYLVAYLVAWFADRVVREQAIARDGAERAYLLFLIVLPFTIVLTVILGGSVRDYVSEMFAMMHLALYFPIRDACRKDEAGARTVVAAFLLFATMIAIRNGLDYKGQLVRATVDWQVERSRVIENDGILMTGTLFFAAFVALARPYWMRVVAIAGGAACGFGLLLTQSRAFWVTFAIGIFMMAWLLRGRPRRRLIVTATTALVLLFLAAFFLLRSELYLILFGFLKRLVSLGSATQQDLSLINRFLESAATARAIATNPIVGHGAGVGYLFFDATRLANETDSFTHNAYLGLWYKWGIWGLGIVLWFWVHTVRIGFRALRSVSMSTIRQMTLLAAVVSVSVYAIAANTSNPFFLNDTLFLFAFLWGVIRGNADAVLTSPPDAKGRGNV